MGCKSWPTHGEQQAEWQIEASCKEGLWYTVQVWIWKVGEKAITEVSEFGECEENLFEVAKGHWL